MRVISHVKFKIFFRLRASVENCWTKFKLEPTKRSFFNGLNNRASRITVNVRSSVFHLILVLLVAVSNFFPFLWYATRFHWLPTTPKRNDFNHFWRIECGWIISWYCFLLAIAHFVDHWTTVCYYVIEMKEEEKSGQCQQPVGQLGWNGKRQGCCLNWRWWWWYMVWHFGAVDGIPSRRLHRKRRWQKEEEEKKKNFFPSFLPSARARSIPMPVVERKKEPSLRVREDGLGRLPIFRWV